MDSVRNFATAVLRVEIRVLIVLWKRQGKRPVDSEKDDLMGLCQKEEKNCFQGTQVRGRTFNTKSKPRSCLVDKCKQNHLPWVCKAFKELPAKKRKELIGIANRSFCCLAAGHHSRECSNVKRFGVDGCLSTNHHLTDRPQGQLNMNASPFRPEEQPNLEPRTLQATGASTRDPAPVTSNLDPREQTHNTSHVEHVSLIILPAMISNRNKELRVNVMLDPCSTSSYISEDAAEELELQGQELNLTITGTGGTEVEMRSRRVELTVTNLHGPLQAHVLCNNGTLKPFAGLN